MRWVRKIFSIVLFAFGCAFILLDFPDRIDGERERAVLLFALPVLWLWFTSLAGQRVMIDEEGVTSSGAIWSTSLKSEDLKTIRLRDQASAVLGATGDYRRLQKVVDLEGENSVITINRPSSQARKTMILEALRSRLPEGMEHLLEGLDEGW